MQKMVSSLLCVVLFLALASSPADAGGWAVVTLDSLPREVVAGQAFTIGFVVRQHGQTLLDGLSPKIQANRNGAFETATFIARGEGGKGHYMASLMLPSEGEWKWKIDAFGYAQPMPALNVSASTAAPAPVKPAVINTPAPASTSSAPPLLALSLLAASPIIGLSALLLWQRKRTLWAVPLLFASTGIGLLGGWLALQDTSTTPTVSVNTSAKPSASDEATSQLAYGHDLFLAKGCVMCHAHSAFRAEVTVGPFSMSEVEPPNLTKTEFSVEHLRNWLKNPQAIKPNTLMPNLDLKQDEIDALAVFLSAKPSTNTSTTTTSSVANAATCPVTKPQNPLFAPPTPYAAKAPFANEFWYGTENLWVMLRTDGTWRALPHHAEGYTQKIFWWRKGYDWQAEPQPKLTVTGKRLDANAPPLVASRATNAYNAADIGSAMLVGVDVPTLGCWEITGEYGGHKLSFVVQVTP
jgi:cytochrome c2